MKIMNEQITFDGNEIIDLSNVYLPKTVKVQKEGTKKGSKVDVEFQEIGESYVSLDSTKLTLGDILYIEYKIKDKEPVYSHTARIQALEEKVALQEKMIKDLFKAVHNRLDIPTFNTWVRSVENKIGLDLIKNQFHSPYP